MSVHNQSNLHASSASPGQILKRQQRRPVRPDQGRSEYNDGSTTVRGDLFEPNLHVAALIERGVLLAPLIVQWEYQVPAERSFGKWLKTKELLLSDVRFGIDVRTRNVRYCGTYIQSRSVSGGDMVHEEMSMTACTTLWGFKSTEAMDHMFDLCGGRVDRVSIVETDLRDFVLGLKTYIHDAGAQHFQQRVLTSAAVV